MLVQVISGILVGVAVVLFVVLLVVVLHNVLGLALGFGVAKALKLPLPKAKSLSIEVGTQNSGLATSLAKSSFPLFPMATVAGAIFLAIATSLPELTSTFVLCKKGNFNAALGDITGSCLFNFMIIALAEFMSFRVSLLRGFSPEYDKAIIMVLLTVITFVFLFISLLVNKIKQEKKKPISLFQHIFTVIVGVIMTAGYIIFLII